MPDMLPERQANDRSGLGAGKWAGMGDKRPVDKGLFVTNAGLPGLTLWKWYS